MVPGVMEHNGTAVNVDSGWSEHSSVDATDEADIAALCRGALSAARRSFGVNDAVQA